MTRALGGEQRNGLRFECPVCFLHEIHPIRAHQTQGEHCDIQSSVSQRNIRNITGCDPRIESHQIEGIHLLRTALELLGQLRFSTSEITNHCALPLTQESGSVVGRTERQRERRRMGGSAFRGPKGRDTNSLDENIDRIQRPRLGLIPETRMILSKSRHRMVIK